MGLVLIFSAYKPCHRNCHIRKYFFFLKFPSSDKEEMRPFHWSEGVELWCRKAYKHIYADYLRPSGRSHEASQNRSREAWLVAA